MDERYIAAAIAISGLITWALRAVPFALLRPLRDSELLAYVGERMPLGVMVILAVYTLHDVRPEMASALPPLVALAVTVALHLWRGNAVLSLFAGTVVCTVLASTLAAWA